MKCPKCNSELIEKISFGSREYVCTNCGYGVAAFVTEPIEEDETIYDIYIDDDELSIDKIKLLSSISNLNFINVKKACDNHSIIYSDKAIKIKEAISMLDESKIKYHIIPEFKW